MAGRGPAPKAQRQRANTPALGEWRRLEPLTEPVLPPLETLGPGGPLGWPAVTEILWAAWCDDPVTQTWNASDIALCVDTIQLHAMDSVGKASEIRIRIDNLGLSPKGRRDARLLLPEEEAPADEPLAEPTPLRVLPEAK
jgi:hypothetical protein